MGPWQLLHAFVQAPARLYHSQTPEIHMGRRRLAHRGGLFRIPVYRGQMGGDPGRHQDDGRAHGARTRRMAFQGDSLGRRRPLRPRVLDVQTFTAMRSCGRVLGRTRERTSRHSRLGLEGRCVGTAARRPRIIDVAGAATDHRRLKTWKIRNNGGCPRRYGQI